jgi:hypothetical protein
VQDSFQVVDCDLALALPKRRGRISLGVRNLLDEKNSFVETDAAIRVVSPERFVFVRASLIF